MKRHNRRELYLEWCLKYTNRRLRNPVEACAEWLREHAAVQDEINEDFDSHDLAMRLAGELDVPDLDGDDVLAAAIGLGYKVEPLDPKCPFAAVMFNLRIRHDQEQTRRGERTRFIHVRVPTPVIVTRRSGRRRCPYANN